jgi:hypothetical protein
MKRYGALFMLALILLVVTACTRTERENTPEEISTAGSDEEDREYQIVYYEESKEILDNPGMGWVLLEEPLYEGRASLGWLGDFPEVGTVSLSTSWAYMEPEEGEYHWSDMDEAVEYWTSKGKMINMRLSMDTNTIGYPKAGAPDWLGDNYGLDYKVISMDGEAVRAYYMADPIYIEKHDAFVKAFAEHYRDNPKINIIEIRAYGKFGEWHSGGLFQSMEERIATLRHLLEVWKREWGEEKLMLVSASYEFDRSLVQYDAIDTFMKSLDQFAQASAYDYALKQGITFRRDGIGGALHYWDSKFLNRVFKSNNSLPLLGEPFSGYSYYRNKDGGYSLYDLMSEALYKIHINYMTTLGWVASQYLQVEENENWWVELGSLSMGYRLVPHRLQYSKSAASGGELEFNQIWSNTGAGRVWNDYDLKVFLKDSAGKEIWSGMDEGFDPEVFVNGDLHFHKSIFQLPEDLSEGEYSLYFGVVDVKTKNAVIKLPVSGNDGNNFFYAGKLTVKESPENKNKKRSVKESLEQCDLEDFIRSEDTQLLSDVLNGTQAVYAGKRGERYSGEVLSSSEQLKLKPGKVYMVHFQYKTDMVRDDIEIDGGDRYQLTVKSRSTGKILTSYLWQDVSASEAERTVLFYTGEDEDCELVWSMENAHPLVISNISIYEMGEGRYTSFEMNEESLFEEISGRKSNTGALLISSDGAIEGNEGMVIKTTATEGKNGVARTSFHLEAESVYYVSFSTLGLNPEMASEARGDYFYLDLKCDSDPDFSKTIANWYEWSDYGAVNKTHTFITGDREDYYLEFGTYKNTSFAVDNFILIAEKGGSIIPAEKEFRKDRNISKAPIATGFPVEINFEEGVYDATYLSAGTYYKGRLMSDQSKIIEGKYSAFGKVYHPDSDEWVEYLNSSPDRLPLKKGRTYEITFQYRVIEEPYGEGENYFEIKNSSKETIMKSVLHSEDEGTRSYTTTITPMEDGYTLHWGIHWNGSIVVDCIRINQLQ